MRSSDSWFFRLFIVAALAGACILGYQAWRAARQSLVIVEWKTASELDTAGFNLYRGDQPEGPFTPVNSSLIPASLDPLTGGAYRYEDRGLAPGRTYYYQLEEIEMSGNRSPVGLIDVKARSGGTIELAAAVLLLAVAAGGWLIEHSRAGRLVEPVP